MRARGVGEQRGGCVEDHSGIIDADVRKSAITSCSIGVAELARLLSVVPPDGDVEDYERAVVDDNVLGLATESGRRWRFRTLRRLYLLRREAVLFRALRDLWDSDEAAQPLLAGLMAMATDTVFRATAETIVATAVGEAVSSATFCEPIERRFPGVYAASTLQTIASKAYVSWAMTGHLTDAAMRARSRQRVLAHCSPSNVAYALMLGHLQGHRGEALLDTGWVQVLDRAPSEVAQLAAVAAQQGMLEYRSAGGVLDVGFRELLRP